MASRVGFSGQQRSLREIALHHKDLEAALRAYFSMASQRSPGRFLGYTPHELSDELAERLVEIDIASSLAVLATVEAEFRVDYLQRCYRRKKDDLSRSFRKLYARKAARASLEDDIFGLWKSHEPDTSRLIGDLRGAFHFRHWLAHGRYWVPKLGRKYDYVGVYTLALDVLGTFPLER
jgi:hypothetical protein